MQQPMTIIKRRIILVGMHNKPGLKPLCSSTRTGKLLDKVIYKLHHCEVLKTNLYDVDYFPENFGEKRKLASAWFWKLKPEYKDIIVLMGEEVHSNFDKNNKYFITSKPITVGHPSSYISRESQDKYVTDLLLEIEESHAILSPPMYTNRLTRSN